jgi:hypothetical protein
LCQVEDRSRRNPEKKNRRLRRGPSQKWWNIYGKS